MIQPVSSGAASAVQAIAPKTKDTDSDADGSKAAAAPKVSPAVVLSLSNVKNDAAVGDPDHDGH